MLDINILQEKSHEELITLLVTLDADMSALAREKESLSEQLRLLLARKYKRKAEDSRQMKLIFDEPQVTEVQRQEIEEAEEEIKVPSYVRKKRNSGRKPLPQDLPREDRIHDLSTADKQCVCGCTKTCIGEEVSEQLEYIPSKALVIRNIRKKYACKNCTEPGIIVAAMPPQPIPKSFAGPGLLAQILVAKYLYHMPLYRQELMLQSCGIDIPRATTSLWVIKCAELLKPLVNLMQDNILNHDVSYADETRVQVLKEKDRTAEKQSFMWCFAGGHVDKFSIVFQYSETRNHTIPLTFFGNDYGGYLHCDGYSGYDAMIKTNRAILVGCMLHARRKFFDITKITKQPGLAHHAIKIFGELAKIENSMKENKLSYEQIKQHREKYTKPILDKFKCWLEENATLVPPKSAISQAINYTLNQWPKMINFLQDGRLEWSNNFSERIMKMFATGRKNWLFCNSVAGAHAGAIIYSIIMTCKHHKVDVIKYLNYILKTLPLCKTISELELLLPYNIDLSLLEG